MNGDMYEIVALAMRYFFAGLMALIAVRAWKITIVDSRRATELRRMSPETGLCGEFLVVTGDGRAREGMRYPVIREGLIGSSRKADVRLRSKSVRRSHAFFELTERGLRLRNHNRAPIYIGGRSRREALLRDGDHITVGHVELMLVLNAPVSAPADEDYDVLDAASHVSGAVSDLFDLENIDPPDEAPEPAESDATRKGVPPAAGYDDVKIYRPQRMNNTQTDLPRRAPSPPKSVYPEKRDEFDNWLDMTEEDEWDDGAASAVTDWDGEWDESPRKKRPEKRRPTGDDDDFFNV